MKAIKSVAHSADHGCGKSKKN